MGPTAPDTPSAKPRERRPGRKNPLGTPGKPLDRRSPFVTGLLAAAGVVVTVAVVELLLAASDVLLLIGIAFFLAVGLEPVTARLARRVPRALAAAIVVAAGVAVLGGTIAAAAVPLADQATQLQDGAPRYLTLLRDHGTLLGRANETFGLEAAVRSVRLSEVAKSLAALLGDAVIVVVLATYFVAGFPRIRTALYRLAPRSRRPRVILIGDAVFRKVGAYLVGNVVVSLIAGVATSVWLWAFGVPYPLVLAVLVAVPVAAAVLLVVREVAVHRLDRT